MVSALSNGRGGFRSAGWLYVLIVGVGLVAAGLLPWRAGDHPAAESYPWTVSLFASLGLLAALAVHRPDRPLPWVLIAAAQLSSIVAELTAFWTALDGQGFNPTDAVGLVRFPLVVVALWVLIYRRTRGWHWPTCLDAAVLATAACLVFWVYVVDPAAKDSGLTSWASAVTLATPVLDLLLLGAALRLMLGGGGRSTAFRFLASSMAAILVADTAHTVRVTDGPQPYDWVQAVGLLSYVLVTAAAWHPSMRLLDARAQTQVPMAGVKRLTVLAAASMLAPTVLFIEYLRGDPSHDPEIAVACMLLFLFVLARMAGLLSVQRLTAVTDSLTGLRNRGFFTTSLQEECRRAQRSNRSVGLVIADADHFKCVNDTYGHPAGDAVLVELANRLRQACRDGDVVARFGGEEFVILMPATTAEQVTAVAETIRAFVAATPITVADGVDLEVTVSVGAAIATGVDAEDAALIRTADAALYAAKHQGRNRSVATAVGGTTDDSAPPVPARQPPRQPVPPTFGRQFDIIESVPSVAASR
jgi:diguanylate cyclase (GGDEF)-like protein